MTESIKLTKQGYIALAQTIKYNIADAETRTRFVRALLPMLYAGNPRFDAVKFCLASGVPALL